MNALTDFLRARIAEDEARPPFDPKFPHTLPERIASDQRWMAECAAKRAIVDRCEGWDAELDGRGELAESVLRALASAYAAHPDYRPPLSPRSRIGTEKVIKG